jgi:hypothetical protein
MRASTKGPDLPPSQRVSSILQACSEQPRGEIGLMGIIGKLGRLAASNRFMKQFGVGGGQEMLAPGGLRDLHGDRLLLSRCRTLCRSDALLIIPISLPLHR